MNSPVFQIHQLCCGQPRIYVDELQHVQQPCEPLKILLVFQQHYRLAEQKLGGVLLYIIYHSGTAKANLCFSNIYLLNISSLLDKTTNFSNT